MRVYTGILKTLARAKEVDVERRRFAAAVLREFCEHHEIDAPEDSIQAAISATATREFEELVSREMAKFEGL